MPIRQTRTPHPGEACWTEMPTYGHIEVDMCLGIPLQSQGMSGCSLVCTVSPLLHKVA